MVNPTTKEPACFSSPSWYEILVQGKKIVGSAQRRLAGAFLQHGSILIDYDPLLEAEVIPGGGLAAAVTSIRRESGRDVPLDEVKVGLSKRIFRGPWRFDQMKKIPLLSLFKIIHTSP